MLEKNKRERIIALVNKEVVPAIGCTEPMAVALCTAKAATTLGKRPERIEVRLSPNMLKNAMGVGIPGTGMIGLPIAVSLGALIGKPEYELEVLKDLTPDTLELGKQYIQNADINIKLKQGDVDKLYIEVICYAGNGRATAIIAGSHTNFVYVERNGEVVFDKRGGAAADVENDDIQLNLRLVYEFAVRGCGERNKTSGARTANVFARVEPELKEQAESVLDQLGIPMSNAVGMFLRQIVLQKGIPFEMKLPRTAPLTYGSLMKEQFDKEIEKGMSDVKAGRVYSADAIEAEMKRDFGI